MVRRNPVHHTLLIGGLRKECAHKKYYLALCRVLLTWQEIFNFLQFANLLAFRGLDSNPNNLTFLFFLFSALM